MPDKWYLSWDEYESMVRQMTVRLELLRCTEHTGHIRGIPRGGLLPAVMTSHQLELSYYGDFTLDDDGDDKVNCLNEHSILIDDILDTGGTLLDILKHSSGNRPGVVAVVIAKSIGVRKWQDYVNTHLEPPERPRLVVGHMYKGPDWVVFPYENQETEAAEDDSTMG